MVDYATSLVRLLPQISTEFEAFKPHQHSWRAFFNLLGLPPSIALSAYLAASLVTLAIALRCWRSRGPRAVQFSVFLLATVLVDPHLYTYDLIVLVPALLLLWNWSLDQPSFSARRPRIAFECLLYACYFAPLFGAFVDVIRLQLSVLVLAFLTIVLAVALRPKTDVPETQPDFQIVSS
jgi:hypothetical protein